MQILGQTPVYLVDCTGKETGHIMVGLIPSRLVKKLHDLCEEEFDWTCGFDDSGFTEAGCTVFVDESWGMMECLMTGIKLREFVQNLAWENWNVPIYHFQGKKKRATVAGY